MSTPGNTDVDVVVVGAGISGLATTFYLQRRGLTVDVLDGATRAGGVIGTIHRDGALVETGPNSALDTTPLFLNPPARGCDGPPSIGVNLERINRRRLC